MVTILWNQKAQSDNFIPNNKRDITNLDNGKGTCMYVCMYVC